MVILTKNQKNRIMSVLRGISADSVDISRVAKGLPADMRKALKGKWTALIYELDGWAHDRSDPNALVRRVAPVVSQPASMGASDVTVPAPPARPPGKPEPRLLDSFHLVHDGNDGININRRIDGDMELQAFLDDYDEPATGWQVVSTGTGDGPAAPSPRQQQDTQDFVDLLPLDIATALQAIPSVNTSLIEVVLDAGRPAYAWFRDTSSRTRKRRLPLSQRLVTSEDIAQLCTSLSDFASDNRATLAQETSTLHRFSRITDTRGLTTGLTMRIGRSISGAADIILDLLQPRGDQAVSLLLVGPPGVGKTTLLRDIARHMADDTCNVVVVDTSGEIGGDGVQPHPSLGLARRITVPDPKQQADLMQQCVTNHTPDVLIIDEIGNAEEARSTQTIGQRGVQLIATAHGRSLADIVDDEQMNKIVGGVHTVILNASETKALHRQERSQREIKHAPVFHVVLEIKSQDEIHVIRDVPSAVKALLNKQVPSHQRRKRQRRQVIEVQEFSQGTISTNAE